MKYCVRCIEEFRIEKPAIQLTRVIQYKHPMYGWLDASTKVVSLCRECHLWTVNTGLVKVVTEDIK